MTFAHPEGETLLRKDHFFVNEQVAQLIQTYQPRFEKVMRAHLFFHLIFLVLGCVEVLAFLLFFGFVEIFLPGGGDNTYIDFVYSIEPLNGVAFFVYGFITGIIIAAVYNTLVIRRLLIHGIERGRG